MFAYVSFKDGKREIVPTKDIRNFDETSFDKKQLYNIRWTDGYFYEGAIAFVGETKSEVQEKVAAKRLNVFPINNCFSASELSDCHDSEQNIQEKKTKKSNEDLLHLKVENLKRKQMEEKKKNDSKKMKPFNLNSRREELKQKLDNKENEEDIGSKEKKYQYSDRAEKIEIEKCNNKEKEENVGSKEKKCPDSTTEKMRTISKKEYDEIKDKCKRLRNKNDILKKLLKERDEEIIKLKEARENERDLLLKCTSTSTELQSKVISRFSEMTDIVRHLQQSNPETASPDGAYPAVGTERKDEQTIHIGRNLWIPSGKCDSLLFQKKTIHICEGIGKNCFWRKEIKVQYCYRKNVK